MHAKVRRISAQALTPAQIEVWTALHRADPAYRSPFFHPAFTMATAQARGDVEIAVFEDGGEIVGFWPFHRRPLGLIRPVGAPVADWQGPLLARGVRFDPAEVLAQLGAAAVRFDQIADPDGNFSAHAVARDESYAVDMREGAEAYRAWQARVHPNFVKELRRRERKAEREFGPVALHYPVYDDATFDLLVAWKRAQYAASGLHDVLSAPWVRRLLARLRGGGFADMRAAMAVLTIGGQPAAIELFLRSGPIKHCWFPAYGRAFFTVGPGHMLTDHLMRRAEMSEFIELDYGRSHWAYKRFWCQSVTTVTQTVSYAANATGAARAGLMGAAEQLGSGRLGALVGATQRRLDVMAAAEPRWSHLAAASLALAAQRATAPRESEPPAAAQAAAG
jgi:CelD/BcsL family acetyltransferase involved in cellulose biosynthesis